jgi:hypothetical protein
LAVRFIYHGEAVDQYFLSWDFVAAEHIVSGDQPLPEEYPAWVHKVRAICPKCFVQPAPDAANVA